MTTEELLKPRYKVIADYPDMEGWQVGDIIDNSTDDPISDLPYTKMLDSFPHLFKKIEWWEDREPEDMPEYLKNKKGKVFKVEGYAESQIRRHAVWHEGKGKLIAKPVQYLFPATQQEYDNQNKTITP